jgi:hypothetical protein
MLQSILYLSVCAEIHILIPTCEFMQKASNTPLHEKLKFFGKSLELEPPENKTKEKKK